MNDTLTGRRGVSDETKTVLHLDVYRRRTKALGATNLATSAKAAGISRSTQYRWMHGISVPDLDFAREVAKRLDVEVDQLFVEVAT